MNHSKKKRLIDQSVDQSTILILYQKIIKKYLPVNWNGFEVFCPWLHIEMPHSHWTMTVFWREDVEPLLHKVLQGLRVKGGGRWAGAVQTLVVLNINVHIGNSAAGDGGIQTAALDTALSTDIRTAKLGLNKHQNKLTIKLENILSKRKSLDTTQEAKI